MRIKTKHMFSLLKIVKKIGVLDKLKGFFRTAKGDKKEIDKAREEVGMDLIISIINGMDLVEQDVYEFLADIDNTTAKEIENQDLDKTINMLKEIIQSDVVKGFFTSIGK